MSQSSLSGNLRCIKWTIWLFVVWWEVHYASCWEPYITGKLWYAAFPQYIWYICNVSISVKVALLLTSGASDRLCGYLWYDQCSTELSIENNISLESCDTQHSNSKYYIIVASLYDSKQPCPWSLVHQMDHLAVCGMMGGPLSFL